MESGLYAFINETETTIKIDFPLYENESFSVSSTTKSKSKLLYYRTSYNDSGQYFTVNYNLDNELLRQSSSNGVTNGFQNGSYYNELSTNHFNNYWGLLALVLVFGTAAGNILVCLAITWERRLQNVTNYFLMSLAITDLMVAVLVMPLGILTLVKGEYIIDFLWFYIRNTIIALIQINMLYFILTQCADISITHFLFYCT